MKKIGLAIAVFRTCTCGETAHIVTSAGKTTEPLLSKEEARQQINALLCKKGVDEHEARILFESVMASDLPHTNRDVPSHRIAARDSSVLGHRFEDDVPEDDLPLM